MAMTPNRLCLLLLALVAVGAAFPQNDEIPVENDNQFPPDNPAESEGEAIIDGSGDGIPEDPLTTTTEETPEPQLEEVQPNSLLIGDDILSNDESSCPTPCVCHTEGTSDDFVVDCSGYDLTEFPSIINVKTTILKLQNNKLTEIPKSISPLKNLKVLNAHNNDIMDLAHGSISELPELRVLNLANNRLIEFPKDLKNSFSLEKLEELDLGGNDMRTDLKPETFLNFKTLHKLVLPTSTSDIVEDLCFSLKNSLDTVCTGSCDTQAFECPDAPQNIDDDLIEATLPGLIAFGPNGDEGVDLKNNEEGNTGDDDNLIGVKENEFANGATDPPADVTVAPAESGSIASRSNDNNEIREPITPIKTNSMIVDPPQDEATKAEVDVKVGAATSSNGSGVDKSVIGFIVAGMVLVVAGITIKKNWSSITNRCSSSPRGNANGTVINTVVNGTAPEEVPLQDKSPV